MLAIEDTWNYRDLGGWTGLNGKKVKYGKIYRGGSLNGKFNTHGVYSTSNPGDASLYTLSDKSLQQIQDIGIMAELDLRGVTNQGDYGNQNIIHSRALCTYDNYTKTYTAVSNLQNAIPGFVFKQIMTDHSLAFSQNSGTDRYNIIEDGRFIIEQVLAGRPVAFHCKSGADRTGAVGQVILALLGVTPGDISRDYELTNFSHENKDVTGTLSPFDRPASDVWSSSTAHSFFYSGFSQGAQDNWQQKAYNFLLNGGNGTVQGIDSASLDTFINLMLE